MGFSTKRGRPASNLPKHDHGTKELREKHAQSLTTEPLDLCLQRNLISVEQHNAGIRLRWLYTLRFGAPTISAYQPENPGASCFRQDSEEWLHARYREYEHHIRELTRIQARRLILNVCVFHQMPRFLKPIHQLTASENLLRHHQLEKFREGLEVVIGK